MARKSRSCPKGDKFLLLIFLCAVFTFYVSVTAIEKGSFIDSMENDRSSETILGLNNDDVDDKMSVNNTSASESVENALQTAEHVGIVVGDGVDNSKEGNETTFKRYDGVAIVTKVLYQGELQKLQQWACLIGHAYNDRMNYDIIVFTTIPWDDDSIRQLQKVVAPGKLSVVNEGPATLDGFLADMTKDEIQFLRERCGIGNNATKTLTWNHHCHDYGTRHVTSLAYSWQAEFRAYHIWKHPALKDYKYMMWLDSDVNIAKRWDKDPMHTMVENDLTVLFAGWPYGKVQDPVLKDKMIGAYNTSICSVQKSPEKKFIYPKVCEGKKREHLLIRQIAGNHHITNLDVFRQDIHQQFLKNMTSEYKFIRKFDDQVAVTLVGAFDHYLKNRDRDPSQPARQTMWTERENGLTLKIGHHRMYDVRQNEKSISHRHGFFNAIKSNFTGFEERCGYTFARK